MYILKKKRGYEENIPGGDSVPPAEKNSFYTIGNPRTGTRTKSRERNASGNYGNPSLPGDRAVPGREPSHVSRSPSWTAAPVIPPGTLKIVCGGRAAVAGPRGVRWRSGASGVEKYAKTDMVLKSHLDMTT